MNGSTGGGKKHLGGGMATLSSKINATLDVTASAHLGTNSDRNLQFQKLNALHNHQKGRSESNPAGGAASSIEAQFSLPKPS